MRRRCCNDPEEMVALSGIVAEGKIRRITARLAIGKQGRGKVTGQLPSL